MSKWTPANEYVPVTKGSTAVVTLQSDGDVYGYMDENTTGVLLASASAGVTKIPTGGFSKITCTAPFILTTESAMSRLRGGQGQNGGGGTTGAYVTWGGENNSEVTLSIPDDVDLPISFYQSNATKINGTTGGKTNCSYFATRCPRLLFVDIDAQKTTTLKGAFSAAVNITSAKIIAPLAKDVGYLIDGNKLTSGYFYLPKAVTFTGMINNTMLVDFTFNLASLATLNFTTPASVGNVPTLENVTVLEGGLASCRSFIITNSTNLTDESIQNIIDALPDYSGTETSALVSFPPDRLTTAQQEQLTNKGWTWS